MTEPYPELDGSFSGSPDAPPPVTPELLDFASEEDMLQLAIEYAQAALPEWRPKAGNTEVVLMESLAQMVTILAFAVQQVPTQLLEQLLRLYGISRDPGAPANAVVRFEVAGSDPLYEIPAGTRLRVQIESTGETVDFTTDGKLEIETSESTTRKQTATATVNGAAYNRIPAETSMSIVGNLPFVERVRLDEDTSGGRDEETDAAFESRAASLLGRLASTLVLPEHFKLAALERAEVGRCHVLDRYDPDQPSSDTLGHLTVVAADTEGQPLTADQKTQVDDGLQSQAMASLIIHVEDPAYTTLSVSVDVTAESDADPAEVETAVRDRITTWLSPAEWPWGGTVSQFALVSEVSQVPGVAAVTAASEDQTLSGVAPLPDLDTVTVNVTQES